MFHRRKTYRLGLTWSWTNFIFTGWTILINDYFMVFDHTCPHPLFYLNNNGQNLQQHQATVLKCAVPEMFAWDWLELFSDSAVDRSLSSFLRGLQEHGEDGKQQRHCGRMTHQLWPHRPRVQRVHRHIWPWWNKSNWLLLQCRIQNVLFLFSL